MASVRFERFPTFHSRNAEAVRAFLQTQELVGDIPLREARDVNARINGVYLSTEVHPSQRTPKHTVAPLAPAVFRAPGSRSGVYLGYVEYGGAIAVSSMPARNDYRILLPVRRGIEAVTRSDVVACRLGGAIITSPSQTRMVRMEHGSAALNVFLKRSELTRQLAALLGHGVQDEIVFAPAMDITRSYGRSLWRYVAAAMADAESEGSLLCNPLAASFLEQLLVVGLLQAHPHNHSAALQRPVHSIAPSSVKRAVDYMQANLDAPITIAELASASGVAGKTLWTHFRRFAGTTPMRYLRDARLDRVHRDLRLAEAQDSVTMVAANWGFTHMGRFSQQYRDRFGENPMETLRRRR